jgi:hypothetical protein
MKITDRQQQLMGAYTLAFGTPAFLLLLNGWEWSLMTDAERVTSLLATVLFSIGLACVVHVPFCNDVVVAKCAREGCRRPCSDMSYLCEVDHMSP